MRKLNQVLSQYASDRRSRWRSAMLRTWAAGDVTVGVTKALDVSLLTFRDSTRIPDPGRLAEALVAAERFARQTALRRAGKAVPA